MLILSAQPKVYRPRRPGGAAAAGESEHEPVMVAEVLANLNRSRPAVVVDGTVGGGGHADAILRALPEDTAYLALDADRRALARAKRRLAGYGDRVVFKHASFRDVARVAAPFAGRVTDCLFDLGVSSDQLRAGRGFSFADEDAFDMRFDDAGEGVGAAEVVNTFSASALADVFFEFGEEPRARAIARAVVARRARAPFRGAADFAAVVASVRGVRRGRVHAATRALQALRIFVNDELGALAQGLPQAWSLLAPGGRLLVLAYHSLEDRAVKLFFRERARAGEADVLTPKPVRPTAVEVAANSRSRSAHLRVAARVRYV